MTIEYSEGQSCVLNGWNYPAEYSMAILDLYIYFGHSYVIQVSKNDDENVASWNNLAVVVTKKCILWMGSRLHGGLVCFQRVSNKVTFYSSLQ